MALSEAVRRPWSVSPERLVVVASLYWVLSANGPFFRAVLAEHPLVDASSVAFLASLAIGLFALHVLMLAPVATRRTVKPVLALLLTAAAAGSGFVQAYGVHLDPAMLRNVLRTDVAEARELVSASLLAGLALQAGVPLVLLAKVRIERSAPGAAALRRLVLIAGASLAVAAVAFVQYRPLSSLMRNHKELRYLVTPANLVWSSAAVIARESRGAAQPRRPLDEQATLPPPAAGARPRVLVLVVGETARAANWGLSGYSRATTPQLAGLPVVNLGPVRSCGTDTETSLPCMFAPVGRRAYDEARIRSRESLLHLLARAGVDTFWLDNQSGCKGVCDGLPQDTVARLNPTGLCESGRCLDEALLVGLDERLRQARGTQMWVLHMLGNHGPSYFRRHPASFGRFQPECTDDDLRRCTPEEIVNAYDNALLYTDHVLARLVSTLQVRADRVDSMMVYVSDHGESLGEKGLYLHGLPYVIAPDEQTRVPMVMWWSDGWRAREGIDPDCLRRRASGSVSHDHLFHTVVGTLGVRTRVYEPDWDLGAGCRTPAATARAALP